MAENILVTGAAGQLGQAVIHHLLESNGVEPSRLIAVSRDPAKLAHLAAKGIQTKKGDFDDAASLIEAFKGADRVLIISTDALAVPGQRLQQHKTAVEAAVAAGIGHIAYTSMPKPDKSVVTFAPDHLGTEHLIQKSGLPYTIIRNAWYHDNYLMSMPHNLQAGKWYTSSGEGRVATIARDDCARAIAAALASGRTESTTFTLTGSQALTAPQIAATISESAGKPLEAINVSDDQLAAGIASAGLPDFVVKMLVSADANIRAGNFDFVTNDFEILTGQQPQSLKDFMISRRAALRGE
ncbi:SDR family oxidoreductase [Oryzifoliimicrobium ureilyticus]|uniref:SDR family oxidoreductase n=1 Tax=Oryzifoliimicrobium ureilyticus TaxID=3113724 RepID=UPI0030760E4F